MMQLSPGAQTLVRAGRNALRPTEADRERVFAALRLRLGDAAMLGNVAGLTKPLSAAPAIWPTVSAVVVGLGVAGGLLFFTFRPAPQSLIGLSPTPAALLSAPAVTSAAPLAASQTERPEASSTKVVAPEPSLRSGRGAADRLAQEVAILSRAASDLHAGRPADALKALDEHQRRFPKGALVEERRAARAQAFCALGRRGEAEAELERLAPSSPQAARARQVCQTGR